jgi:Lon protease-like protein
MTPPEIDSIPSDLRDALRELPIFPLHQAVLFPGTLVPLHVFEPRYRELVRDVIASHRALSIAHVIDPEADMGGNPLIAEMAGVGTIVEHQELPGGRFNIVLLGRARVRLQELPFVPPYRRAEATIVSARDPTVPSVEMAALTAATSAFAKLLRQRDPDFKLRIPKDAPPSIVIDACAHHLVINPSERQSILEMVDVRLRAQRVTEVLTTQRAALARPSCGTLN